MAKFIPAVRQAYIKAIGAVEVDSNFWSTFDGWAPEKGSEKTWFSTTHDNLESHAQILKREENGSLTLESFRTTHQEGTELTRNREVILLLRVNFSNRWGAVKINESCSSSEGELSNEIAVNRLRLFSTIKTAPQEFLDKLLKWKAPQQ